MPPSPLSPSLISLMVSVDVKHHVYLLTIHQDRKENASGPHQFSTTSGSLPARPEAHESGVFVIVPIRSTRWYFRRVGPFVISRCLVRLILCNCNKLASDRRAPLEVPAKGTYHQKTSSTDTAVVMFPWLKFPIAVS